MSVLAFPTPACIVENVPFHARLLPYQGYSNCRLYLFVCLAALSVSCSMFDLVPWPGRELKPPPLGVGSFSHWSSRDFVCVCGLSRVRLSAAPWNVARQAPLSLEFSRQGYWGRLPFSAPRDLPNPGMELRSLTSPVLAGGFFTTGTTWEAHQGLQIPLNINTTEKA